MLEELVQNCVIDHYAITEDQSVHTALSDYYLIVRIWAWMQLYWGLMQKSLLCVWLTTTVTVFSYPNWTICRISSWGGGWWIHERTATVGLI